MRQAGFTMISMAKARGIPVIICGSDASDHAPVYLQQGADYVLIGEGEATLIELLALLTGESNQRLEQILGLAFWEKEKRGKKEKEHQQNPQSAIPNPKSEITINLRRPDLKTLDELPFPAWDLVDVEKYRAIWLEKHGYYSMNMVTTRGCPYHCNWCAKPIWGQRYNSRSPENVVAELKWLKQRYQPDHIWFADDILGLKPGWLERFGELVEQEGVQTRFKCLSRADLLLRGNTIEALAKAGCEIVWVGAESGSQRVLDAMEKGTKVSQIYESTKRVQAAGFRIAFFLQFGYPGETRQEIELTLQMVRDCQPDDIGMSVSYPLPGTTFFERVRDELGLKQNWVDSADFDMLYEGPFAADFYRHLHRVLHMEYRARKTWGRMPALLSHPTLANLRQIVRMAYYSATLPLARRKLDKLAALPHQGAGPIPPGMSYEAAATPTPQNNG